MLTPKSLQLILDTKCDNRCNICGASWPFKVAWNTEEAMRCLEKGVQAGITQLVISGGEVTLRADLLPILHQAKALGYDSIVVLTNGRRLADNSFLPRLVGAGISGIGTTLYSFRPEIHEVISKVSGSFSQTVAGIRATIEATPDIPLSVNVVVTLENYRELGETIQFLLDLGVRSVQLTFVVPIGRARGIFFRSGMPSISEMLPFVRGGVQEFNHLAAGRPRMAVSTVFFPRCVLGDLAPYAGDDDPALTYFISPSGVVTSLKKCLEQDHLAVKTSLCADCIENGRCMGVWQEYIGVWGWNEFVPLGKE